MERLGKRRVALVGRTVKVRGAVSRYYPGAKVIVQFVRAGKVAKATTRTITRVKGSRKGEFFATYKPGDDGRVLVTALHKGDRVMADAKALPITVTALRNAPARERTACMSAGSSSSSSTFTTPPRSTGSTDGSTARAVLSFKKMLGMDRNGHAGPKVFAAAAAGRGAWKRAPPQRRQARRGGPVAPAAGSDQPARAGLQDLHHLVGQVLDAHHPRGLPLLPQAAGTNGSGMIHSNYFIRGYAIHGYHSVPTYPASHGCLRVPPPSARFIYDWIGIGDRIFVYY